jgi:hypothetical protein
LRDHVLGSNKAYSPHERKRIWRAWSGKF